jgi:hypothetical protein
MSGPAADRSPPNRGPRCIDRSHAGRELVRAASAPDATIIRQPHERARYGTAPYADQTTLRIDLSNCKDLLTLERDGREHLHGLAIRLRTRFLDAAIALDYRLGRPLHARRLRGMNPVGF